MTKYSYAVRWSDEDEAYIAVCPDFPGLSAFGDTPADAVAELDVAVELAIETHEAEGWPLPMPSMAQEYSGQFRLRLPRSLHAELAQRAEIEGTSLNALALSYVAAGLGRVQGEAGARSPDSAARGSNAPARRRRAG
ncbi:type II toxin-antitoxin system HicB family antitoxin [Longimicrobium sp.]|uniref:type II toxin-antitoxin system HicB family antitoxin n=1 Tax=Longimicrobium sp. TaxID=2029185 RepID=UPI002BE1AD76|nr:type II toxin-antitoxin system HicB family antitoxin [Longimicrobium sp.]HSU15634.1 type II toxin-antitoxin system HicB family antitoxin [Longimicrobium sp.]